MEETIVRGDLNSTPDLHATIRRLSQQVSDLQQALNPNTLAPSNNEETMRPSLSLRRRRINSSDDRESDDQRSETSKRRHGIRANTLKISTFDGTDFHLWEFSMIRYMKILKLWEYVSGEIQRPNQADVSMDEIIEWDGNLNV